LAPTAANNSPVFTLAEFCERNRMSKSTYYKLPIKPRFMAHHRITLEAETEWRRLMEEETNSEQAQLEAARRAELSRRAGAKAAKSPLHISNRTRGRKAVAR
jgi:hypothetical protein